MGDWSDREFFNSYHKQYYHQRRKLLMDRLGDSCAKCGSFEELEFDHVVPELKTFDINTVVTKKVTEEILQELGKCQILCRTCHELKTAKEAEGFTHGTVYSWLKIKCSCEVCLQAKRVYNDERNRKRRKDSNSARGPYGRETTHGEYLHYTRGCRCELCRKANREKERARRLN